VALLAAGEALPAEDKLNFVVLLADDLGWADLGCTGSRFYETPHLDRLAAGGVRFAQAYSACTVCSPTRAALLTGQYPARLRVTDWIPGHARPKARLRVPDWTKHLPLEQVTLAEALGAAGYVSASIGKWHLGGEAYFPEKHGFGANLGGSHRGQPPSYFSPYGIPTLPDGPRGEYLTDREGEEAARFIERNKDRRFFLYVPFHAVHTPLQAKKELIEKYQRKAAAEGSGRFKPVYAAMIESLDAAVGRILEALEKSGVAGRTVVVFTSDNGGLVSSTSNRPLRAGKGSWYEGGVRVPLIVRGPGIGPPGSVLETPVITMDLYPTLLELAGLQVPAGRIVDGVSLAPLLRGSGGLSRTALFWHYPHYHPGGATPYGAVRRGDLKLIESYEDGSLELYDLARDAGESENLAGRRPDAARELRDLLAEWRRSVGAQMPSPNPDYDPGGPK
jgi:arylsulfatase A-like enzyme